ncbi:hypothetical protein LCGC14_1983230, partial [marine sediment metagenome]
AYSSGRIPGEFIAVESEHAAMAGCVGASAAGSRTFTATASQGLLYMMEMVYFAGMGRLPMTMTVVNRALYGGWSIWVDHQDLYSMRDTGWIQVAAKNNQEAHDLIPQMFKLSENHDVYLPAAVNIDGFTLSHVAGQVEPLQSRMIDDFETNNKTKKPIVSNRLKNILTSYFLDEFKVRYPGRLERFQSDTNY